MLCYNQAYDFGFIEQMDGKKVLKRLKQNGWQPVRIKGSHHHLHHPKLNKNVTVPVHGKKDLKLKTLKSIERATGVKFNKWGIYETIKPGLSCQSDPR